MTDLIEQERVARIQDRIDNFREPLYLYRGDIRPVAARIGEHGRLLYGEAAIEDESDVTHFADVDRVHIRPLLSWHVAIEHDEYVDQMYELTEVWFGGSVTEQPYTGKAFAHSHTVKADVGEPALFIVLYRGQGELSKWLTPSSMNGRAA